MIFIKFAAFSFDFLIKVWIFIRLNIILTTSLLNKRNFFKKKWQNFLSLVLSAFIIVMSWEYEIPQSNQQFHPILCSFIVLQIKFCWLITNIFPLKCKKLLEKEEAFGEKKRKEFEYFIFKSLDITGRKLELVDHVHRVQLFLETDFFTSNYKMAGDNGHVVYSFGISYFLSCSLLAAFVSLALCVSVSLSHSLRVYTDIYAYIRYVYNEYNNLTRYASISWMKA